MTTFVYVVQVKASDFRQVEIEIEAEVPPLIHEVEKLAIEKFKNEYTADYDEIEADDTQLLTQYPPKKESKDVI